MPNHRSSDVRALLRDALAHSGRFVSFMNDPATAEPHDPGEDFERNSPTARRFHEIAHGEVPEVVTTYEGDFDLNRELAEGFEVPDGVEVRAFGVNLGVDPAYTRGVDFVVDNGGVVTSTKPTDDPFAQAQEPAGAEVPRRLRKLAELFDDRYRLYGDNYLRFGDVMAALFPTGLEADTFHDWNRLGLFTQMIYKLTRYASQFREGGHPDSLDDLAVYTMMLREVDNMADQPERTMADLYEELN